MIIFLSFTYIVDCTYSSSFVTLWNLKVNVIIADRRYYWDDIEIVCISYCRTASGRVGKIRYQADPTLAEVSRSNPKFEYSCQGTILYEANLIIIVYRN